jgi:hypothetical protein
MIKFKKESLFWIIKRNLWRRHFPNKISRILFLPRMILKKAIKLEQTWGTLVISATKIIIYYPKVIQVVLTTTNIEKLWVFLQVHLKIKTQTILQKRKNLWIIDSKCRKPKLTSNCIKKVLNKSNETVLISIKRATCLLSILLLTTNQWWTSILI